MKVFLAAFFITVGMATAYAGGFMMLHVGSPDGGTVAPLVPCTSTGIFDLSNTCNDIYIIGALK